MTPKEKAEELVNKYSNLVTSWDCYWDTEIVIEYKIKDMKQCALIAVDEILKVASFYNDSQAEVIYFKQVKQEIENL